MAQKVLDIIEEKMGKYISNYKMGRVKMIVDWLLLKIYLSKEE